MMRHHLSELSFDAVETRILHCLERPWEKRHDPCDEIIVETAHLPTPKIGMSDECKRAWLAERLGAWVSDTDAYSVEAVRRRLPDRKALGDPAMFRLLLDGGVNPHALLLLAMTSNQPITCVLGDGTMDQALANMSIAPGEENRFEIMVQLGPGIHWSGERLMMRSDIMPDTMLTLLEGMPLGEVIEHPALRQAGRIVSITPNGNGFMEMRLAQAIQTPFSTMKAGGR